MNTHEPMPQERLDAIRSRVDNVEFPDNEHLTVTNSQENLVCWVERSHIDGSIVSGADVATVHAGPRAAEMFAHAPQDLTDLLTEVERLRALTTVDDAMVERAARAYFEYPIPGEHEANLMSWDRFTTAYPHNADSYREETRAALNSAHNPGEGS